MRYTIVMNNLSPNLQSIFDNRLRYLPDPVKNALTTTEWVSELIAIGKQYGIHIDEMEEFQSVVIKSLVGMLAPEQFENALITATAVSPATAEKMIHDINEKIFQPIHDKIMHPEQKPSPHQELESTGIVIEEKKDDEPFFI